MAAVQMQQMSKTYQYRKVMKPLLERKRRARINKCLDELKDLMTECLTQQGENIVRLEKADILELTVDHLKRLREKRSNLSSSETIQSSIDQCYRSGYIQAANEVSRALATYPGVNISFGTKVMAHLGHRLVQIENQQHQYNHHQEITNPLKVNCGNNTNIEGNNYILANNYIGNNSASITCQQRQQLSPTVSSGYGSDNESVSSSVSGKSTCNYQYQQNRHHPYYSHHGGLLKVVTSPHSINETTTITIETDKKNVWRPW